MEGFIYGGACAMLDTEGNLRMVNKIAQAVVMALFLVFCPLARIFESTKCPDPALIRKMITEGGMQEIITLLGWLIDSRQFTTTLLPEKWIAWLVNIRQLSTKQTVDHEELSSIIGQLNHTFFYHLRYKALHAQPFMNGGIGMKK